MCVCVCVCVLPLGHLSISFIFFVYKDKTLVCSNMLMALCRFLINIYLQTVSNFVNCNNRIFGCVHHTTMYYNEQRRLFNHQSSSSTVNRTPPIHRDCKGPQGIGHFSNFGAKTQNWWLIFSERIRHSLLKQVCILTLCNVSFLNDLHAICSMHIWHRISCSRKSFIYL